MTHLPWSTEALILLGLGLVIWLVAQYQLSREIKARATPRPKLRGNEAYLRGKRRFQLGAALAFLLPAALGFSLRMAYEAHHWLWLVPAIVLWGLATWWTFEGIALVRAARDQLAPSPGED